MNARADLQRLVRASKDEEGGQALVEFALVMPLVLLLVMTIIQFGIMLSDYSSLVDAARSGARALALGTSRASDPCDPAVAAAMASSAGQITIPSGDIAPTFPSPATAGEDYCGTSSSCTYVYDKSCNTNGAEVAGDQAEVTIAYPYKLSVFGLGILNITLTTSSTDSIE